MTTKIDQWHYLNSVLRRYGRLDIGGSTGGGGTIPSNSRDLLTYGQYEPDATNTGLIQGTVLSDYNSTTAETVTIPNGAVIQSKRIYGDVTFAGSALVENCIAYGGTKTITSGNTAVFNCNNTRTGIAVIKDTTIAPRTESNGRDCILGKQYELWRCKLSGGVDGAGIYTTSTTNTAVNVKVVGSLIQDLVYVTPDTITPSHSDGTHNDCIQIQGGRNIWVMGNSLRGTAHALPGTGTNPAKPWLIGQGFNNGACVVIQDNTKAGIDRTVVIEDNYLYGALSQLNVKPGIEFDYNRNHHYRGTAQASGWAGYWVRFDDHTTTVHGLNSGTNTNRWVDGPYAGQLLAEPRDLGIHYNV